MTIPIAIEEVDALIKAWRADELTALRSRDAARAHDCCVVLGALGYLRERMLEKAAA